jgi:AcrR family transcriptional regulator
MRAMTIPVASLRERQAGDVRAAVLEAALEAMETREADDLSMADIAALGGVSLRTLYRYFPDRTALLQAAGERLYASLGVRFEISAPEDIATSFRDAARRLGARSQLARALVRTRTGRSARGQVRARRVEQIRAALAPMAAAPDEEKLRLAGAVIAHLCGAEAWISVADESDLADAEAQEAVGWAIDTLVHALRQAAGVPSEGEERSR